MNSNIEKWFTSIYKNNELYTEDKEKLMEMYKNIPKYKFSDIFNKDPSFHIKSNTPLIRTKCIDNRTSLFSNRPILISTGLLQHENNIYKILILEKDYIFKDVYCIEFLKEIYFHKLAFNSNNNNNVIIPEIQDYGELIDMENNETLYFYKMPYYEKKLNTDIDTTYRIENNDIVIVNVDNIILLDSYKKYMEGYNVLLYLREKYNINHNDIRFEYVKDNLKDNIENYLEADNTIRIPKIENFSETEKISINEFITKLQNSNMYISNNKCIIIDFEFASRRNIRVRTRHVHERMLELDTE